MRTDRTDKAEAKRSMPTKKPAIRMTAGEREKCNSFLKRSLTQQERIQQGQIAWSDTKKDYRR